MASNDTSQEKTQDATPERIEEQKKKGQFARSKEITTVLSLLSVLLFFWLAQEVLLRRAMEAVSFFLRFDSFLDLTPSIALEVFWIALIYTMPLVLPFFLLIVLTIMGSEMAQTGLRVVEDPLEIKWKNLNPADNIKKVVSLKKLVEGFKSFLKFLIFAYVIYSTLMEALPQIARMGDNQPAQGFPIMVSLALRLAFRTCLILTFLAAADYWFQRWQYYKGMRMSHQDIKEEIKKREGDPMLKGRMRSIQMEIARKRMMQDVPEADFILTNPTHYAVALKYDPEKNAAPLVVAKGQNFIAQKIRELAREKGIPLVENPPLAREIYKKTQVGHPIPANLFRAVAQIMASIYQLAEKRGSNWAKRNPAQTPEPRPAWG